MALASCLTSFRFIMSSPPHPLFHLGMTGWFHIKGISTVYYRDGKPESEDWPPRFWKFSLTTKKEPSKTVTEAAFVDSRRFARIRLIDCPGKDIRNVTPLKENGPDPVIDRDILTEEWLAEKCKAKRVPIKALLLDQANMSGIGNWVGYVSSTSIDEINLYSSSKPLLIIPSDELLYHSGTHPEQYAHTLTHTQLKRLHASLIYVTSLAVETLAESAKFPEDWLFKHRWGKGKKDSTNKLPNGDRIVFLTVGGRTSAVVPTVQKKTGPVAGDIKGGNGGNGGNVKKRKALKKEESDEDEGEEEQEEEEESEVEVKAKEKRGGKRKMKDEVEDVDEKVAKSKPARVTKKAKTKDKAATNGNNDVEEVSGRRRSGRLSGKT